MLPPPPLGGNKIKLLGKKVNWGRREKGEGRRKGKKERGREGEAKREKGNGKGMEEGKGKGRRREEGRILLFSHSSRIFPFLSFPSFPFHFCCLFPSFLPFPFFLTWFSFSRFWPPSPLNCLPFPFQVSAKCILCHSKGLVFIWHSVLWISKSILPAQS